MQFGDFGTVSLLTAVIMRDINKENREIWAAQDILTSQLILNYKNISEHSEQEALRLTLGKRGAKREICAMTVNHHVAFAGFAFCWAPAQAERRGRWLPGVIIYNRTVIFAKADHLSWGGSLRQGAEPRKWGNGRVCAASIWTQHTEQPEFQLLINT